jgi:ribosomal protein S18 acetylase RimI-like enzyme
MLWRARTTLPDRPGALARLADACGRSGVNILGLQIFPDVDLVTDELVLRAPDDWGVGEVAALLEGTGGQRVSVMPCGETALVDQPTRYVQAAHAVLRLPASFPEVAAELFEAEADPADSEYAPVQDVLEMLVGDVRVHVRRTAAFTAIEQARAGALADLVTEVLGHSGQTPAAAQEAPPPEPQQPAYLRVERGVQARVGEAVVGEGELHPTQDPSVRELRLWVDQAWRRRGIGTRLLLAVARAAADDGARELVLEAEADNQAVLPVVLASGLRSRIRLTGESLVVRVPVHAGRASHA